MNRLGHILCRLGWHAWTPWFQPSGRIIGPHASWSTICGRCHAEQGYDL